jgi:hypothetical protein
MTLDPNLTTPTYTHMTIHFKSSISLATTLLAILPVIATAQASVTPAAAPSLPLVWRTDKVGGTSPLYEVINEADSGRTLTLRRMPEAGSTGSEFGTATTTAPAESMRRLRVTVRAELRTREAGGASLWLRAEGGGRTLLLENNGAHAIAGTSDWTEQTATLDLPPETERISYGLLLGGNGEVAARNITVSAVAAKGPPVTGNVQISRP